MAEVAFGDLIHKMTGHIVIATDTKDTWKTNTIEIISNAADSVMEQMNLPTSPIRQCRRVNEVSRHFEDALRQVLNSQADWKCAVPTNAADKQQRSGYPDLDLLHVPTGRRVYLDPKVYDHRQHSSSLRTFYYEPRPDTSKVGHDAMHLLIGFEHDGAGAGKWQFQKWSIVDMSRVKVRLKLEFQTSNRELYRSQNIVGKSGSAQPLHK